MWVLGWRAERLDAGQLNRNCRRRAAGLAVSQATARAASERVCVHAPPCVHFLDSRGHDQRSVLSSHTLHLHNLQFRVLGLDFIHKENQFGGQGRRARARIHVLDF